MSHIFVTYDLSSEDYENEKDEVLEDFLLENEFSDEYNEKILPSTTLIKNLKPEDDVSKIEKRILEFCEQKKIRIENLLVIKAEKFSHHEDEESVE